MVNIEGLDRAEVLMQLYNYSKPLGLGFLQYKEEDMSLQEAKELLENNTLFDYLNGRVMKVNLKNDTEFEEYLYDRDNGDGAAQSVINILRKEKQNENKNK